MPRAAPYSPDSAAGSIKHNSAVGLVDRRKVELRLSPRGRRVLARLAAMHRGELQRIGPIMKRFFSELTRGRGDAGD